MQHYLNDLAICHTYSADPERSTLMFRKGRQITLSKTLAQALQIVRTKWAITVGVFCRNQKGENYGIYTEIQAQHACHSDQLADIVKDLEIQLCEYAPKLEKLCAFWIATPRSNNEPNDLNLAIKTAHEFQVFELITLFEKKANKIVGNYHHGRGWYELAYQFPWTFVDLDLAEYYEQTA